MNPTKSSDLNHPRVLFVDDEPFILEGLRRTTAREFQADLANSGEEGLARIRSEGPYPVVVSDMRMPGMDGASFLAAVRSLSPDSIRVMLTGYSDLEDAKRAVNEGRVFHFLCKPVTTEDVISTLRTCVAQYRAAMREKELLENTLAGAIGLMTEVLSVANPAAFSKGVRLRQCARHIATKLSFEDKWQYEIAAMLSELGCVTLTPDLLDAVHAGRELTPEDAQRYLNHPKAGHDLIARIPRLEAVAEMILKQKNSALSLEKSLTPLDEAIRQGAQMLKVVLAYDLLLASGSSRAEALMELRKYPDEYDQTMVGSLQDFQPTRQANELRLVEVCDLQAGMVLREDLRTVNHALLATKGQELTNVLITMFRNFVDQGALRGDLLVSIEVDDALVTNQTGTRSNSVV